MKKIILTILLGAFVVSLLLAFLLTKHDQGFAFGDKIAVVNVHGGISLSGATGFLGGDQATPQKFKEGLKKAEKDSSVKAILVDINSPGGSVVASAAIAEAIKEAEKPTVCWLGEIAASGGYYVASACDFIIADRATITGSLGVISVFPEYSKFLEKIGVNITVIKAGEFKDFSSGFRPMSDEEKEMMESVVLETYDVFLSDVAENRNLSFDYLKSVAEGKIYTGSKAKELGLVDEVGNRDYAIRKAAQLGGIEGEPSLVEYRKGTFLEEFVGVALERFGYGLAKGLVEQRAILH
ncbi:MAG: signal peptide peptidase SppA [Candidatus Hydrothermarchaeales archaeon]